MELWLYLTYEMKRTRYKALQDNPLFSRTRWGLNMVTCVVFSRAWGGVV